MPANPTELGNRAALWPPTWPMALTLSRLLLLPVFLFILIADSPADPDLRRWMAAGVFAVMALSDLLDGYLARRLNQTSNLGQILDPIADKVLMTCSVIALSFQSIAPQGYRLPWYVPATVLLKDITVVIGVIVLLPVVRKIGTAPRVLGKVATFLQLTMLLATLIGLDLDRINPGWGWWTSRILWIAVVAVTMAAFADYLVRGVRLLGEKRKAPGAGR